MTIGFVRPPDLGNFIRGVGVYADSLYDSLHQKGVAVKWLDFSFFSGPYQKYDLIHFPFFDPFFLTLPFWVGKEFVITVHDLTPIIFPQGFPRGVKGEIKWLIQKTLLKNASGIITVSQSSKNDIAKIIDYPENKIFVTYEAASRQFHRIPNIARENMILYVGDVNYNKNLLSLITAFAKIPRPCQLILVGKAFLNNDLAEVKRIKAKIKELNLVDRVIFPGFVNPADLVALYNRAKVYVQPSIYEGFGLPIVEAMACGTPVVCGQNSSLPEVAGDAATYADVTSVDDLAEKIGQVKKTGKEISQAKKFSWEKTAQETYAVYQKVLSGD